jgi:hypothetical protein
MVKGNVQILFMLLLGVLLYQDHETIVHAEGDAPVIEIANSVHTFPAVFEGETLSHGFTVFNRGGEDLIIGGITTS